MLAVLLVFFFVIVSPLLPTKKFVATYAVVSGSMSPKIPVGALAFVQFTDPTQLQNGDVIAFPDPKNQKIIVLHRIVGIEKTGTIFNYSTKGDANNTQDPWRISSSTVRGKMLSSIPTLGYPIQFAQSPKGFIVLVGIPAALLTVLQFKTIKEGIEEEVTRRTQIAAQSQQKNVA